MNGEIKKYKVTVLGDFYTLVSDESEQHIIQAALMVDTLMKEIAYKAQDLEAQKVAVLAALKLASNSLKSATSLEHKNLEIEKILTKLEHESFLL